MRKRRKYVMSWDNYDINRLHGKDWFDSFFRGGITALTLHETKQIQQKYEKDMIGDSELKVYELVLVKGDKSV